MFTFKTHWLAVLVASLLLVHLNKAHSGLFPEMDIRPRLSPSAESLFILPDLFDYNIMVEAIRPKVVIPLILDPDEPEERPPSVEYMATGQEAEKEGHEKLLEEHRKRMKERQKDLSIASPFEQDPEDKLPIEDPHEEDAATTLSVTTESISQHNPKVFDEPVGQNLSGIIQLMDPPKPDNQPASTDDKEEDSSSEDEEGGDSEGEEESGSGSEPDTVKSKELSTLEQHDKNLASLPAYALKKPDRAYFSKEKHLAAMIIGGAVGLAVTEGCSMITRVTAACVMAFLTPTVMNILQAKYAEIRRGSWSTAALIVHEFSKRKDEQGRPLWVRRDIPGLQNQILRLAIQWQQSRSLNGVTLMLEFFYIWAAWIERMDSGNIPEITEAHVNNIEALFHAPTPSGEEQTNSDLQFNAEEAARQVAGHLPAFTSIAETDDSLFNLVNYVASLSPGFYLFNNLILPELLALAIVHRPYQERGYYIFLAPHLSAQHFYTTSPEEVEALIRVIVDTLTDPGRNRRLSILRLVDNEQAIAAAAFSEPDERDEEEDENEEQ
ncbi:hypothetical protein [Endozoicomonas arenosclerae]|uniref:hypothetical protein n=1 Tax=Endozoicomonas arenosclerae TaxID=1633495 RepID=UPI00078323F9|nr:hypothetical protein [Endozoicomonas arenosclerae]